MIGEEGSRCKSPGRDILESWRVLFVNFGGSSFVINGDEGGVRKLVFFTIIITGLISMRGVEQRKLQFLERLLSNDGVFIKFGFYTVTLSIRKLCLNTQQSLVPLVVFISLIL